MASVKIQQNSKNGQYWVTLPKLMMEMLGMNKGDELEVKWNPDKKSIMYRKK